MEMTIKCGLLFIILLLIAWVVQAEEITTGNLLPNNTGNSSSYQSIDSTIPNITTNGFNTSGGIRDWGQEIEVDGTGSINYTGTLLDIETNNDITTQEKLNNGIRLDATTVVQNCEWIGSQYQCGQARSGQDTFKTKVQILDEDNNVLAEVNQLRNNDAGYGANAFKYQDAVIYTGSGSNKFYWEWEGVDMGSNVNLGGANLLGAKLTMTYDNTVIPEETIEEIYEVIEQFEEWEQTFIEPENFEQLQILPLPLVFEELLPILEEEEFFEVLESQQELEEEFEEVEILQVFEEQPNEEEVQEQENKETNQGVALQEESISEETSNESKQTQSATVETNEEQPETDSLELKVADVQKEISKTIKAVDKQLAVTNIIVADVMQKKQVSLQSYFKEMIDNREIYQGQNYEDKLDLSIYDKQIYTDNRMVKVAMNDPLYKYQESIRQATLKRVILEQELKQLRGY